MELVKVLKALGDETRVRILNLLIEGELCVCEIEYLLDLNQSNASRHLIKLTEAKIITYYKKAKYVYYKLNEETLKQHSFLEELTKEMDNIEQCKMDLKGLKEYKNSGMECEDIKQKCN